jgi:hypothetical protein
MSPNDPARNTEVPRQSEPATTRLASRVFLTWAELVAVGFLGAVLGGTTSGPPRLVVYLATVLGLVAVSMHNVDKLVTSRLKEER